MTTHLGVMALFAACVAVVFGTLMRDHGRDQLRLGVGIFGGLVVGAYVVGWVMFGLFR
ncbi:MAG: hypothetical protein ABI652_05265 [Acidobacteriota bacterium]